MTTSSHSVRECIYNTGRLRDYMTTSSHSVRECTYNTEGDLDIITSVADPGKSIRGGGANFEIFSFRGGGGG